MTVDRDDEDRMAEELFAVLEPSDDELSAVAERLATSRDVRGTSIPGEWLEMVRRAPLRNGALLAAAAVLLIAAGPGDPGIVSTRAAEAARFEPPPMAAPRSERGGRDRPLSVDATVGTLVPPLPIVAKDAAERSSRSSFPRS